MNILHDYRDVSREAFADGRSGDRRHPAYEQVVSAAKRAGTPSPEVPTRQASMAEHPPGYVEYGEAMGPRGQYGRWLRARPAAVQVGRTVFMHPGLHLRHPSPSPR